MLSTIANNVGVYNPVLYCTAEMTVEGLSDRDIAGDVGEPVGVIRQGKYSDEVYAKIVSAIGKFAEIDVYLYQDIPMTTAFGAPLGLFIIVI